MPAKKDDVKKEEVKRQEEKVTEVEVELNVESPSAFHTLFFNGQAINFVNGKAKVDSELAKELKNAKYVK